MRIRLVLAIVLALLTFAAPVGASPAPGGSFTDDDGNTHEATIEAIATIGVTRGCNPPLNDHYCPGDTVRRDQVAAFIVRALDLPAAPPGDPFTDDSGIFEDDIERLAAAGITRGCNPPANDRYCPGADLNRAQVASFFARALELATPAVPPRTVRTASLKGSGFGVVTWIGSMPGDSRTFVANTAGLFRELGAAPGSQILDIRGSVSTGGERGLLGVAVHPSGDGRVVVAYTDTSGDSRFDEYVWDGAQLVSPRLLLRVDQPASNHNGGALAFDQEGGLYIGLGDGGGGGDPYENGENPSTLLGSVLRIVPDGDAYPGDPDRNYSIPVGNPFAAGVGGDPAVWLWGVRNPWRIHVDEGLLYVADVGQGAREEVNVVPTSSAGGDLGWDRLEGTRCYEPTTGCTTAGTVVPVLEYTHSEGCSITGGVVTPDGPADVDGSYLYADFCAGWVRSFEMVDGVASQRLDLGLGPLGRPTTFGIGPDGAVYLANSGGQVFEINP
jgi:glucose/arabinose dehydrogenase